MEVIPSSELLDLDTIRSRIRELEEIHSNCKDDGVSEMTSSDSEQLLKDCAFHLESKVKQIMSECSDYSFLGIEDLDAYLEQLKEELNATEAESSKIANEIEVLNRSYVEDSCRLESNLEGLGYSIDLVSSQDFEKGEEGAYIGCPSQGEDKSNLMQAHGDHEFEILKLDNQIEKSKIILKSLQDLDAVFKRFDANEQIEDALSGLKIIEFEGNCIRLSLRTYVPKLEDLSCKQKIEDPTEPSEVNHELLIEVINGTMELMNVEMFPNDVYIGDIIGGAKSFRQLFSPLQPMETRSSLEWFVRKVQDRIIQCTLRRLVVKSANKSRHSFEYLERDEMIVSHLVGGIDAFIKVSEGWPLSSSPLKLSFLKSSDYSREISLSFLCKVEGVVNSLDAQMRQNLTSFADAIEKVLVEQMRLEFPSDGPSKI